MVIVFFLFCPKHAFAQTKLNEEPVKSRKQHKRKVVAKFVEAGVWEGAGSYSFIDKKGSTISFVFDNYNDQNIPYQFFDSDANTNAEYVNSTFTIIYTSHWEIRGEYEEKILVNRIVKISLRE